MADSKDIKVKTGRPKSLQYQVKLDNELNQDIMDANIDSSQIVAEEIAKDSKIAGDAVNKQMVIINWKKVNTMLKYGATLRDVAFFCNTSQPTIIKKIKNTHKMTFAEYRDCQMATIRKNLLMKQYEVAMNGDTKMLIFLGKNYLKQVEKVETTVSTKITLESLLDKTIQNPEIEES